MGDFPGAWSGGVYENVGLVVSGNTRGTTFSADASTNTKNATWTELISATVRRCEGFWLCVHFDSTVSTTPDALIDISIGSSGNETSAILINNLILSHSGAGKSDVVRVYFPIPLAAGTRISCRCQASVASVTLRINLELDYQGFHCPRGLARCTTYGAATGDSGGVAYDPGATANTKGGWTEIVASTSFPIKALILGLGKNGVTAAGNDSNWAIDIGVGSSPVVLIPNRFTSKQSSGDNFDSPYLGPFPVQIPAGTRIAINAQCSVSGATTRVFDAVIYGLN